MSAYVGIAAVIFAAGLGISAALVPVVRRVSVRLGFVDHPNPRKVHRAPMPLGGGVAIYLGVALPALAGLVAALALQNQPLPAGFPDRLRDYLGGIPRVGLSIAVVLGGGLVLMLMGLADDRRSLPWPLRLGIQMAVAFALWIVGVRITVFIGSPMVSAVITVLWITVITNAFNFLDNMDGLSAGVAAIVGSIFLAVAISAGQFFVAATLLCLIGSLVGFLLYNFPPARIFMGDAGSNFIGFLLGALTAMLNYYAPGQQLFGILAPLVILALPLYDFTSVVLIRLAAGQSPFKADQRHFSHRLVALGLTPRQAVLTIYLVTFSLGVSATLLPAATTVGAVTIFVQVLVMIAVIWILERAAARRNGLSKDI
jgi:UDP-GlcNAc:undecaprenyl-phosphate GlcNAc-1-phosphate transferase